MSVGDLAFNICLIVIIYEIIIKILNLIYYKYSNKKEELSGLCKCLNIINHIQKDKYYDIKQLDKLRNRKKYIKIKRKEDKNEIK